MGSTVILVFSEGAPELAKGLAVDQSIKLGEVLSEL